eukprot:TRINITY_DN29719_c0_g1_i1.p2 TRINITY_DN29719_c0_g1~~TRINITY_DN29719_c0_g1_i1.p2  ORF type:complete len:271 (+),score=136.48 TRINITY_DN29719_c0_g1_i1:58-870(+)
MATTGTGMDVLDRHEWKFTYLPKEYDTLDAAPTQEMFKKWDLAPHMQVATFTFDQTFMRGMADDFVHSFFNNAAVKHVLQFKDAAGGPVLLGKQTLKNVEFTPLECNAVRLDMFDKLVDAGVVRETGSICKMMDQFLPGGVTISDQLRALFMNEEESEQAGLFTEDEKDEFLYHVMWRLLAGGAMCQYEDDFTLYKNAVRGVYKDFVSVTRNSEGQIQAVSDVYHVQSLGSDQCQLFGRPDFANHNFCYLIVNSVKRQVHYWYHSFVSPF